MKNIPIYSACIFLLLLSCSTAKNAKDVVGEGKSYNNLFIIANTADISARVLMEKDLAAALASKGYLVVKSIDVLPPSLNEPKPPSKEEMESKIKEAGSDAILVIGLLRKADVKFSPGYTFEGLSVSAFTGPYTWGKGYGYNRQSKQRDEAYASQRKSIYVPNTYKQENGIYIYFDFLDAALETIIYSEKSELIEEDKLIAFSGKNMAGFIKQLETKKILKLKN